MNPPPRPACAPRRPRASLQVEQLECRQLLDAGLAALALPPSTPQLQIEAIPSDASFSSQWALNNTGQTGGKVDADIDAPEAWDVTTGSLKNVVAVIDTGIDYTHPDLYR